MASTVGPSAQEATAPAASGAANTSHVADPNNFQDPDAFLAAGGRRGRQYQTLTDGTYFINRWVASVETIPKTTARMLPTKTAKKSSTRDRPRRRR